MENTVKLHLEYNLWANKTLLGFLRSQSPGISEQVVVSSFSGIRATLLHLTDAEAIWLSRLEGNPLSDWPSKTFTGSEQDLYQLVENNSQKLYSFYAAQNSGYQDTSIGYTNMKGEPFTNTVAEILLHLTNHAAFHRGQVVTMLRQLGATGIPSTDLIAFYRKKNAGQL